MEPVLPLFNATPDNSDLQLAYVFRPDPDPIRASPETGNPRKIDLRVIVSNPTTEQVQLRSVSIHFPIGQDIAAHLSGDPRLPEAVQVTPGNWKVAASTEGNSVLITPAGSAQMMVFEGNPLIFSVRRIPINTKPGEVVLTITEKPNDDERDIGEARLEKLEADFPVSSFTATPNTITDLKQVVQLNWTCTPEGQKRSYSVHDGAKWRPRNCLTDNQCYSHGDGQAGVATPPISAKKTFYLDVIQSEGGRRKIQKTLSTRVDSAKLELESAHHLDLSPSGRIAKVGWLAHNAVRCSVFVNGQLVDGDAPADTYLDDDRYYFAFPGAVGTEYKIEVMAHAASGAQTARLAIGPVKVGLPVKIDVLDGQSFRDVGISKDGRLALLMPPQGQNDVRVLDIPNRRLLDSFKGENAVAIALVPQPDYTTLYFAGKMQGRIVHIDDSTLRIPARLLVGGASAPRRKKMLLREDSWSSLKVITETTKGQDMLWNSLFCWDHPIAVAITPDEKFAFVAANSNFPWKPPAPRPANLGLIDLDQPRLSAKPLDIVVGMDAANLAIAATGTCMILTGAAEDSSAKVIDVAKRQVIETLAGAGPGLVFTPDGRAALLGSEKSAGMYQVGRREFQKFQSGTPASVLAISPGAPKPLVIAASKSGGGAYLL